MVKSNIVAVVVQKPPKLPVPNEIENPLNILLGGV